MQALLWQNTPGLTTVFYTLFSVGFQINVQKSVHTSIGTVPIPLHLKFLYQYGGLNNFMAD